MGIFLNPGNESFAEALNSEIYVDKSELISVTNKRIKNQTEIYLRQPPETFRKITESWYACGVL